MSGVVVIDDAGTPGTPSGSRFLHLNRKHWAAVIIPSAMKEDVREALSVFVAGVRDEYGAQELHFPEIYGGRGVFKDVPIERRYELFGLMSDLLGAFQLPILFQTFSPEFATEMRQHEVWRRPSVGWFRTSNHEHMALLFLLCEVVEFCKQEHAALPEPVEALIDEGLVKADSSIPVPQWTSVFRDGLLRSKKSHEEPFLQLADFAAFSIARTQWILASAERKHRDAMFLQSLNVGQWHCVNTGKVLMNLMSDDRTAYEDLLVEDRLLKGLPGDPPTLKK